MRHVTDLHASRQVSGLHLAASQVTANPETRNLSGVLIPYGVVGYTTIGPVIVPGPGRITLLDADLSRVKLVDEHREPPVAIGYMTAVRDTPDGLRGAHYVADTDPGQAAWADYMEGARDAFSVELIDVWLEDPDPATYPDAPDVPLIAAATLKRTAFVTTPAWADARPDGLAASHTTLEGSTMTDEQRARLRELAAMNTRTEDLETEFQTLQALAVTDAIAEEQADEEPTDAERAEARAAGEQARGQQAAASRTATRPGPARVPSGTGRRPAGGQRRARPLSELFAAFARVGRGQSTLSLEAALSDITGTANIWTAPDEYAGQLWAGLEYRRRFVPLMASGTMTSYKGTGWRWVVKPEVDDYAGDKAPVPSNAPTTEAVEWAAARLAGAHDLDRKFWDFGDDEFIAAYYAAMRESYAIQSDDKARAFLLASAAAGGAAETSLFRAAAVAAQAVQDNTGGQPVDYFLVNSADQLALLDITEADIPAYLSAFGVTPDKFIATPGQVAGTVTAGTKPAATFKELTETPIRVEAVSLVNGGVDGGVFGYYATLLNHEGGIVKQTFA
jgi:hypothetical protein